MRRTFFLAHTRWTGAPVSAPHSQGEAAAWLSVGCSVLLKRVCVDRDLASHQTPSSSGRPNILVLAQGQMTLIRIASALWLRPMTILKLEHQLQATTHLAAGGTTQAPAFMLLMPMPPNHGEPSCTTTTTGHSLEWTTTATAKEPLGRPPCRCSKCSTLEQALISTTLCTTTSVGITVRRLVCHFHRPLYLVFSTPPPP